MTRWQRFLSDMLLSEQPSSSPTAPAVDAEIEAIKARWADGPQGLVTAHTDITTLVERVEAADGAYETAISEFGDYEQQIARLTAQLGEAREQRDALKATLERLAEVLNP